MTGCSVAGCERPHYAKSYCSLHWRRWRRWGDPMKMGRIGRPPLEVTIEWVMAQTAVTPAGCREWQGSTNMYGYGRFAKATLAHRWVFEHFNGPLLPEERVLHHCDNPPCLEPSHLFKGTQHDNILDMISKGRHAWQRAGKALHPDKTTEADW